MASLARAATARRGRQPAAPSRSPSGIALQRLPAWPGWPSSPSPYFAIFGQTQRPRSLTTMSRRETRPDCPTAHVWSKPRRKHGAAAPRKSNLWPRGRGAACDTVGRVGDRRARWPATTARASRRGKRQGQLAKYILGSPFCPGCVGALVWPPAAPGTPARVRRVAFSRAVTRSYELFWPMSGITLA